MPSTATAPPIVAKYTIAELAPPSSQLPQVIPPPPAVESTVAAVAGQYELLERATRYRGELTQRPGRKLFRTTTLIAGAVALPVAGMWTLGWHDASALKAAVSIAGISLMSGAVTGAVAWIAANIITPKRHLKPEHLAKLEQTYDSAGPTGQALAAAVAERWLARLDTRRVVGFGARQLLQRFTRAEASDDAKARGQRLAEVFDRVFKVARDDRYGEHHEYIERDDARAIIAAFEALTPDERAAAGEYLTPYLFAADGKPLFRFREFSDATRLQNLFHEGR